MTIACDVKDPIALSLFREKVSRVVVKRNDTSVPDSLGDQLFRMSLKLFWASTHPDTAPTTPELVDEACRLLGLAESQ